MILWRRLWQTRQPINGLTHGLGAVLTLLAMAYLFSEVAGWGMLLVVLVYGLGTLTVYVASTLYHWSHGSAEKILRLRRLDHAAIYLMIAGTYTPFVVAWMAMPERALFLVLVWAMAIGGMWYKLTRLDGNSHLSTAFYLAMGWLGLLTIPFVDPPTIGIQLLLAGGILYSLGAVFYATRRPNISPHFGHHEIWHLFILAASACHFFAVSQAAI